MEEKMIVRSPEEQQIILRTNRILQMRLEQRVPGREEQLKLFDLILLRMSEKDASALLESMCHGARAQTAVINMHRAMERIQTEYHL